MMKLKGSWRTSATGIAGIAAGVAALATAFAAEHIDVQAIIVALGMISAGVTGLLARDNQVTSKDAGAEK